MNKLLCQKCGSEFSENEIVWKCTCGGLLDLKHTPKFPTKKIRARKHDMWRYREAIPISNDKKIITFSEGFTPLLNVELHGKIVQIKQEQLFSTGSYKDRGASVLISKVRELGINHVIEDSSGNAGCAIAAYCAAAKIGCDIYVPSSTALNKLVQLEFYGANVIKVPGTRGATATAARLTAEKIYYASHSWNPYFLHGTKTFAFEVCEQFDWSTPDVLILPAGNGTLLLGAYIGFSELKEVGIIESLPRIIAVQAANCAPIANAFMDDLEQVPEISSVEFGETIAEGIAITEPIRGNQILKAVKESKGNFLTVNEVEIENALIEIGNKGFYIEPTSAATIAGINKYIEITHKADVESIVSVFTGHGLKNTEKMLKVLNRLN